METTNYNLNTGQTNEKYKEVIIKLQHTIVIIVVIAYISYMVYILM